MDLSSGGLKMNLRAMNFGKTKVALGLALGAVLYTVPSLAADLDNTAVKAPPMKPAWDAPFFFVNDNRLTYSYIFKGTDTGVTGNTAKQVYSLTHFDVWAYGTNFMNLSLTKSDKADPANPCPIFGAGCAGATEFYGLFRSTFGLNEIFNTKAFTYGILHNVSLEVGADAGTENNFFASAKRDVVAGLQFSFDLPYKGFFNVAPLYYKEVNHNSFSQCGFGAPAVAGVGCLASGGIDYRGTWAVETNYYMDLGFLPQWLPLSISGRAGWYGAKGLENAPLPAPAGGTPTVTEFNSEPIRLTFDASRAMWGDKYPHFVDVWVAYRFWQNKFGLDHANSAVCTSAPGSCTESSLYSGISIKF
jgi:hypothetical protein